MDNIKRFRDKFEASSFLIVLMASVGVWLHVFNLLGWL